MPSARLNQSHEDNHLLLSHHHLLRSNTDMEFRDSFSKLKKKVKNRLTGRSAPKPNETGADVGGDRVDSTGSRSGSEPHLAAGVDHDQGEKEANADGSQDFLTIRPPQPDEPSSVPARRSANNQEGRGVDIDGGEVEVSRPHPHSADAEVEEGSGPAVRKNIDKEEVERVYPSPSATSILHDGKPDST